MAERVTAPLTPLGVRSAMLVAAVAGVLLWTGTTVVAGRREAWDAGIYWTVAYPAGIVISGILGYVASDRPWRSGAALKLAQAAARYAA